MQRALFFSKPRTLQTAIQNLTASEKDSLKKIAANLQLALILNTEPFSIEDAMQAVRNGGDPNIKNQNGLSLLHRMMPLIFGGKYYDYLELLVITHKADIKIQNKQGDTPLQYLINGNFDPEGVMKLISLGADSNSKDKDGNSVIYCLANRYPKTTSDIIQTLMCGGYNAKLSLGAVKNDDLKVDPIEAIGNGTYGMVFLGKWKNQPVAIKSLTPPPTSSSLNHFIKNYSKEAIILNKLGDVNASNVIKMIGCNHSRYEIVMEYAKHGTLDYLIHTKFDLPIRDNIIQQIVKGVASIHNYKFIHRDLKAENILICDNYVAKIGDFGFAIENTGYASSCGTYTYMAPEVMDNKPCTEKSDVYALALLMLEVESWKGITELWPKYLNSDAKKPYFDFIKSGNRFEIPGTCKPKINKLIRYAWQQQPERRPTAAELSKLLATPDIEVITKPCIP